MHFPTKKLIQLINDNTNLTIANDNSVVIRPKIISITDLELTVSPPDDEPSEPEQTTVYLSTFGGTLANEKWVDISTTPQDNEGSANDTQYWAQTEDGGAYSNGEYIEQGNGQGLINTVPITINKDTQYYLNCYDRYDDDWEGAEWILTDAPLDGNIIASGINPSDEIDNTGNTWGQPDRFESTTGFSVSSVASKTKVVTKESASADENFIFSEPNCYYFGNVDLVSPNGVITKLIRPDLTGTEKNIVVCGSVSNYQPHFSDVLFNKISIESAEVESPEYTLSFYGCQIRIL